jgi:hypothetical protein
LLWRAPTGLGLPVIRALSDGNYLSVLIDSRIRGRRQDPALAAAHAGSDLGDPERLPEAFDERGRPVARLARVIEYDVPDRDGTEPGS